MRSRSLFLLLVSCILLGGCETKRLSKANVDEVLPGMAKKQVESILGLPTSVETQERDLAKKTTYIYVQGKDTVKIVFWDDRLESKESTIAE